MASKDLIRTLERLFKLRINGHQSVSGGDIAKSYTLNTSLGVLFLKVLDGPLAYEIFAAEADGLEALKKAGALSVPKLHGCARTDSGAALLMEYIQPANGSNSSRESLGRGLALMHRTTSSTFGWHRDNFIGSLPQKNTRELNWAVFFTRHRLMAQFEKALSLGLLNAREVPHEDHMIQRITALMPELKPALLHGDLWGGNYIISKTDFPYLIDPSVYFGHSEVDLAMSRLFGGFPAHFYDAYFEISPPQPGYEERVTLYQLYYLLVHLNLFGRSYLGAVSEASSLIFGGHSA